jgi:hypothetical protein
MSSSDIAEVPRGFDCGMRRMALEFAMKLQPFRSKAELQEMVSHYSGIIVFLPLTPCMSCRPMP